MNIPIPTAVPEIPLVPPSGAEHFAEVLQRRIRRINDEYAVAPRRGLDRASFVRRARNLSGVYLNLTPS